MAGHSKWANIKHRKKRRDVVRGKVFTKLIRAITVAARVGGGDIAANSTLRLVVDKALTANMPRNTIDRAIQRGAGGEEGVHTEVITYEGYGPSGVAVLIECLTDNKNRTVADIRYAFSKCGGNLGTGGSVAYLFKQQGVITFAPGCDEEKIMNIAIESGAEDVVANDDGSVEVYTSPTAFAMVKEAITKANLNAVNAEVAMVASNYISVVAEDAEKILQLVDMLEDLDDVQNVYTNADIPLL